MRWTGRLCATGLALLLAGCEQAPEVHDTIAGLQAFRAGNRPAFDKAYAELLKLQPDPAVQAPVCSREDFAQRRAKLFDSVLGDLIGDWDGSETSNSRYFRLQASLHVFRTDGLPPLGCPPTTQGDNIELNDQIERTQVLVGLRDILVSWGTELGHVPPRADADPQLARPGAPANP